MLRQGVPRPVEETAPAPVPAESKRGAAALRIAVFVVTGQIAVSSASTVARRLGTSSPPASCMASATISTVVVSG
jgi:hypothetical protein